MDHNPQSQLKLLIAQGKEQGYLTYAEVNDHLPEELIDTDQIEDIIQMINDMGIQVLETAPDADDLMLNENIADEDAVEEATQVLSSVEAELGRTTDPVRMYMREMGSVELLTREGEIDIAKRIEDGINEVQSAVAEYPEALTSLLEQYDAVESGSVRLADLVTGFVDLNVATEENVAVLEEEDLVADDEDAEADVDAVAVALDDEEDEDSEGTESATDTDDSDSGIDPEVAREKFG
ncbi:MAG TPA: RNA polymerase sigma factor RpoD, partial [Pasteurellaceae bacterium]|nr:RNA polymerase sigma factor RpoD [Pasteurellaceae bacterium]